MTATLGPAIYKQFTLLNDLSFNGIVLHLTVASAAIYGLMFSPSLHIVFCLYLYYITTQRKLPAIFLLDSWELLTIFHILCFHDSSFSQFIQLPHIFLFREFPLFYLFVRFPCAGYLLVPLVDGYFLPLFSALQPVIGTLVFSPCGVIQTVNLEKNFRRSVSPWATRPTTTKRHKPTPRSCE